MNSESYLKYSARYILMTHIHPLENIEKLYKKKELR